MKTTTLTLKKDMVIVGCHWRWDVATKARVVEYIISNGIDAQAGPQKDKYTAIAKQLNVSWQSVMNWVKQYRYTYATAQKAPRGTVVYSPLVIARGSEKKVTKTLAKLHKELAKLRKQVEHAPGATVDVDTVRNIVQSVQDDLSDSSTKSE